MLEQCRVDLPSTLFQKEAAEYLGVTPRTLRNWHRDGFGPPPTRVGPALLYDRAAVEAFRGGVR